MAFSSADVLEVGETEKIMEYKGRNYRVTENVLEAKAGDFIILKTGELEEILSITPAMDFESIFVKTKRKTYPILFLDGEFDYAVGVE